MVGCGELMLRRTAGCHGDGDAADADPNQGADFQQPQPDGTAGRLGNRVWASPIRRSAHSST
jgi:hypothetical protein